MPLPSICTFLGSPEKHFFNKLERAPYGARFFYADECAHARVLPQAKHGKGRRRSRRLPRAAKRLAARARSAKKQCRTAAASDDVGKKSRNEKAAVCAVSTKTALRKAQSRNGVMKIYAVS